MPRLLVNIHLLLVNIPPAGLPVAVELSEVWGSSAAHGKDAVKWRRGPTPQIAREGGGLGGFWRVILEPERLEEGGVPAFRPPAFGHKKMPARKRASLGMYGDYFRSPVTLPPPWRRRKRYLNGTLTGGAHTYPSPA